jgi:TonB-linked SusC/RagA family outer membrane protein
VKSTIFTRLGLALVLSLFAALPVLAQTGSVIGTVSQSGTGQALAGVRVQLEDTDFITLTRDNGRYLIPGVPAGTYTLVVDVLGHERRSQSISVTGGQVTTVNLVLEQDAISLQEIVVTGTAGAVAKAKVPFDVAGVNARDIPVPAANLAASIQGKVAGATVSTGSGRPGNAPSILMRGPKSLNNTGRDQEPLYIVDGVILASGMADLGGLDIERVEILKGAAAASLYGSRAANGVIQVTTRRGRSEQDQQVRYTVRSEFGTNTLPGSFDFLRNHAWELTPDGSQFVNSNGTPCDFLNCSSPRLAGQTAAVGEAPGAWNSFAANPWPGGAIDQVGRFFSGGNTMENYVAAAGRTGATNFHVSFSNLREEGILEGARPYERVNFRLNLDQNVLESLQVAASAFYSKSEEDTRDGALFDLTRMQAGVDLTSCLNDAGQAVRGTNCLKDPENLILNTNPTNTESPNPLYDMLARTVTRERGRFLASTTATFTPHRLFGLEGNVSYDRFDRDEKNLYPKGYRTLTSSSAFNNGNLTITDQLREAINASITATTRFNLGDNISNITRARYLYESTESRVNSTGGNTFAVAGLETLNNVQQSTLGASSSTQPERADGYFFITNFDIFDRYVIDALVRNDGSSLFGRDERRQWYYRVAGAWRLGEESFVNIPRMDELKLRYSIGTAGNRPSWAAQYETYSVTGGNVTPVNLGNVLLKPEHTTEQEAGVDMTMLDGRLGLTLTYAFSDTKDQILQVPLPAYSGFTTQWQNAATVENKTWEVSLDGVLWRTNNTHWSARVLFDRTRSTITDVSAPPFKYGVPAQQGLGSVFFARPGEAIGTYYGVKAARGCEDLPVGMSCDGFAVNNEGYLVWVGSGGLASNAWGTTSGTTTVRGSPVMWGTPFVGECTDRLTGERDVSCPVGNSMPDYSAAFSTTFSWKGLTLYGLLDAVQGFDVYNLPLQWALFRRNIGMMDQSNVPEDQRKPVGYYDALYNVSGLQPSNVFVEDGSYVKLREVAVTYRVGRQDLNRVPLLGNFDGITLRLSGRNLHTWTNYRGYDPETGRADGDTGSAAVARVDGYTYPNFRTWKLGVELNF